MLWPTVSSKMTIITHPICHALPELDHCPVRSGVYTLPLDNEQDFVTAEVTLLRNLRGQITMKDTASASFSQDVGPGHYESSAVLRMFNSWSSGGKGV